MQPLHTLVCEHISPVFNVSIFKSLSALSSPHLPLGGKAEMASRCLECPPLSLLSTLEMVHRLPQMILDNLPNLQVLHSITFAKTIFPYKVPSTGSREWDLISVAVINQPATLLILANEGTCHFFTSYNLNLTSSPPQLSRSLSLYTHSTTESLPLPESFHFREKPCFLLTTSKSLGESPAPVIIPLQCRPGGVS